MLLGMMDELTHKDILYEPMKELDDKFPDWFAKNRSNTPATDVERYEEQQGLGQGNRGQIRGDDIFRLQCQRPRVHSGEDAKGKQRPSPPFSTNH